MTVPGIFHGKRRSPAYRPRQAGAPKSTGAATRLAARRGSSTSANDPLDLIYMQREYYGSVKEREMASVSIRNVRKAFGRQEVLKDVSLEIEDSKFVVIVGPSGCGKSTLLRLVAGLEDLSSGEIWIGGEMVNDLAPRARDIAMVFQSYALYPHMTVADNIGFSLRLRGVAKPEIEKRIRESAAILNLEPYLARYPRELSGGQRQRVAMGRAIVRHPEVFLFDEPLSNLDAKLRVQMRVEILALRSRLDATTVYVTHDQVEAMTMADIIVVMRDGVIEQVGTPLELYDSPANMFVGGFLGSPSMNFLNGRLDGGNGAARLLLEDGTALALASSPEGAGGRDVVCGVRPEHFAFGGDGVPATVRTVESTGSATLINGSLGGQAFVAVFTERLGVRPGETINVTPNMTLSHLFDSRTGARL
jgi:multiple sugar transport system ATP-binding protein